MRGGVFSGCGILLIIYALAAMSATTLRRLVIPAIVLGILLVVVAIVYFTQPEHSLPSFFPGHASAGSAEANHHHAKHGIAALIVALACFAFAWFQSGPKNKPAASS
jgi:Na+/H+ antiporter NhaD/arsenite permease-like protein